MARDRRDPPGSTPGKLKAAARHWAASRQGGSDELDDDLRAFGLADQIRKRETGPFGVWPKNWGTVRAFMELEYCWVDGRSADGSRCAVLDQGKIKHTLDLLGVKRREWPEVFNGLKVMETEVIKAMVGAEK